MDIGPIEATLAKLKELLAAEIDRLAVPNENVTLADADAAVGGDTCCINVELWRYGKIGNCRRTLEIKLWDGENHHAGKSITRAMENLRQARIDAERPQVEPMEAATMALAAVSVADF